MFQKYIVSKIIRYVCWYLSIVEKYEKCTVMQTNNSYLKLTKGDFAIFQDIMLIWSMVA